MTPLYAVPDDTLQQPTQNYPDCGTIDPSLLMCVIDENLSQYIPPSIPPSVRAVSPSISAEVWMGFLGEADATYATLMESCICGCGGGACIPQREYDRPRTDPLSPQELQEMILFRVNGRCGYPLGDALKKQYTGLDGRDEKMFVGSQSSVSIRLEWLPYEKWTRQIRTLTWQRTPDYISRAKLACEVAKRMNIFFEEMQGKQADPSYQEYRVQPGIIDVDHLELVALKRVSRHSWMPHFRLIRPLPSP